MSQKGLVSWTPTTKEPTTEIEILSFKGRMEFSFLISISYLLLFELKKRFSHSAYPGYEDWKHLREHNNKIDVEVNLNHQWSNIQRIIILQQAALEAKKLCTWHV